MAQLQSTSITGSLIVTQGITGSFSGSATNAISASYAATASYALNAGDSIWTGSAGDIYYNGGNVGIGTTTPAVTLQVDASGGGLIRATRTSAGSGYIQMEADGTNGTLTANNILYLNAGGSTKMTVLSGGNVGIGTTSPAYTLDVNGYVNVASDLYFGSNTALRAARRYVSTANLSSAGYTVIGTVTGDALASSIRISLQGTANSTVINVMADILVNHYQDILITSYAGMYTTLTLRVISNNNEIYSIEATTDSAFACTTYIEIFPLNSETVVFGGSAQTGTSLTHPCVPGMNVSATGGNSGNLTVGGNVGIGTTSPGYKLEVGGTLGVSGNATFNGGNVYINSDYSYIGNNTTDLVSLSGNTMYLPGNGNVGIGTTSPAYKLDVSGVVRSTSDIIGSRFYTPDFVVPSSAKGLFNNTNYSGPAWNNASFVTGNGATGVMMGGDAAIYSYGWIQGVQTDNGATKGLFLNPLGGNVNVGGAATFSSSVTAASFTGSFSGSVSAPGSTTQIVYNSSGVLTADSGLVYSSGNVGIGTTSPSAKLHVKGAWVTNEGILALDADSGTRFSGLTMQNNGTAYGYLYHDNTDSYVDLYAISGTGLRFYTADTTRIVITSGGNVGIGTTTPRTNLHVWNPSTGNAVEVARFTSAYAGTGDGPLIRFTNYLSYATNPNAGEYNLAGIRAYDFASSWGGALQFLTSVTTGGGGALVAAMTINQTQQVGIGTTSPSALLHVSQPSADTVLRIGNNSNYDQSIYFNGGNDWSMGMDYSNSNAFVLSNYSSVGTNDRLVVTTGGNVGIGTTSPGAKLDVNGTVKSTGIQTNGTSLGSNTAAIFGGTNPVSIVFNNPIIAFNSYYDSGWVRYSSGFYSGYINMNPGDGDFEFLTDSNVTGAPSYTKRLVIKQGGSVGIGTTNPTFTLSVQGIAQARGGVYVTQASPTNTLILNADDTALHKIYTNSSVDLSLGTNSSTSQLYLKNGGNVGIGTTSPGAELHVQGTSTEQVLISYDSTRRMIMGRTTGYGWISPYTNGVSYDNLVLVRDGGNVGIGTTSPASPAGFAKMVELYSSTTVSYVLNANNTDKMDIGISSNGGYLGVFSNNALRFATNNTERIRITSDGNVGIGTTSPTQKLEVNGNTWVSGTVYINRGVNSTEGYTYFDHPGTQVWKQGIFSDNTSTFSIGNGGGFTRLLNITNAGNVGIGTTSPASRLEVGNFLDAFTNSITVSGRYEYIPQFTFRLGQSGTNLDWTGGVISCGDDGNYNGIIYFKTANAGRDTPTTKMVIKANGNVGIGTTSPAYKLDVNGTGRFSDNVTISSNFPSLILSRAGTTFQQDIRFQDSGANRWAIGQAVNAVGNTLDFYSYSYGQVLGLNYTTGAATFSSSVTATNMVLNNTTNDAADTLRIYRGTSGGYQYQSAIIDAVSGDTNLRNIATDSARAIVFSFSTNGASSYTERMRITSGGNVGIGTTNPTGKLTISQNNSGGVAALTFTEDESTIQGPSANTKILMGGNLSLNAASTWIAGTNGSERMRITSDGNVGIGTTNPSNGKLQVNGRIYTVGTAGTANAIFQGGQLEFYKDATPTYAASIGLSGPSSGGTNDIVFETYGGTWSERMRIATGGNVGIGTTSPAHKLHVAGNSAISNNNSLYILDTAGSSGFQITNTSSNVALIFQQNNNTLRYRAGFSSNSSNAHVFAVGADTEIVRFTNDGNVGIGTTSPGTNLQVNGGADTNIRVVSSAGGYAAIQFGDTSDTVRGAVSYNSGDNSISIRGYDNADRLFINSAGNVGIGVTAPAAKLQVSGSSNVLNVRGSGSATTSSIFSVDGTNGRLFEVSDDLSNSLFSVNTIAGLPVIEAFADYTVTMGTYGAYTLQVTGSRVGVGTSSPGYPLHVSGSVSGISIYATNDIAAFSDQSVKTDLQVIDSAVDRIKQINGYTYVRVDDLSNTRRAGVIAQEVQKVLPEVVSENNDGTLNVAYSNMIALLIEGMKEQQTQIDKLREDLEDLRYEL